MSRAKEWSSEEYCRKAGRLPTRKELLTECNLAFAYESIDADEYRERLDALGYGDWRARYNDVVARYENS